MSTALAQGSPHGGTQPPAPASLSQEEKWRRRYPQPVLVSDLIGRQMLNRDQGVLGHIETLAKGPDGEIVIAFARRRLFLFKGAVVQVPAKVAALLGPFVMILDLSFEEIDALPAYRADGLQPVDRSSKILMALTKH